jgi:S-formylglutathione hydrolase FrmB
MRSMLDRRASRFVPLVSLALASCARAAPPRDPAPDAAPHVVEGEAFVAKGAAVAPRGVLVAGWLTEEEARRRAAGRADMGGFRRLLQRLRVIGEVDLAATPRVPYRIEAPPGARPFLVVDVDHAFWSTMFGGGPGLMGMGEASGGDLALSPHRPHPRSGEPCSGPRYKLITVRDPRLAGTVGNSIDRRFCAYLPRSYGDHPGRRYPMVLMFPGLFSGEMSRMRGRHSAAAAADEIARATSREAILVGVDTSTRTASTYLEDSPVTGAFDSFLAGVALDALQRELRTIERREARGLVGNSTGGLNAMSYGMRHPEKFSAIGACSPDALDLPTWIYEPGKAEIKPWIRAWTSLEDALGGPGQMTSYGSDWSPDSALPRGFAWPFDLVSGKVDEAVMGRWVAHSPAGMMADRSMRARVRHAYGGRIYITVARGDEFDLHDPARRFSDLLFSHGIEHTFAVTGGGHGDGAEERVAAALGFVIGRLSPAR